MLFTLHKGKRVSINKSDETPIALQIIKHYSKSIATALTKEPPAPLLSMGSQQNSHLLSPYAAISSKLSSSTMQIFASSIFI